MFNSDRNSIYLRFCLSYCFMTLTFFYFSLARNQLMSLQMSIAVQNSTDNKTKVKCLNAEPEVPKCEVTLTVIYINNQTHGVNYLYC